MFSLIQIRYIFLCFFFFCLNSFAGHPCASTFFENKDILYIGDSHSYLRKENGSRMGNEVLNGLYQCGAREVQYHAVCGSSPRSWMPGKTP